MLIASTSSSGSQAVSCFHKTSYTPKKQTNKQKGAEPDFHAHEDIRPNCDIHLGTKRKSIRSSVNAAAPRRLPVRIPRWRGGDAKVTGALGQRGLWPRSR